MYMNKSVVYLFVSVFFLFTSCEYRLGENFMDFEKWQADSVAMSVDFYGPFIHDWENKIFVVEHSGNAACKSVRCSDLRLRSRSSALERWNGKAMGHDVISCWMWI